MPDTSYHVTARAKHPAWDERDGITYAVYASSKAQAIRFARRQHRDNGHVGVWYFTAQMQQED